jgi:hypothetical protein
MSDAPRRAGHFGTDPQSRPTAARMLYSLARSGGAVIVHAARTGRLLAPEAVQAARWEVCRACDQFDAAKVRCMGQKGCGCWIRRKIPAAANTCPLGKWPG